MKIAELLNITIPKIEVGSNVIVENNGEVYSSCTSFANRVGFPNAVIDDVSVNNPISKKVYKGLKGTVLAKDKHSERNSNILCVVEAEDGFQFIIGIKGLSPVVQQIEMLNK